MDMKPLVSVILPVKNGALFIKEALQSVETAVRGISYEILVVNDGSTDDTEKVLRTNFKHIQYFFQKNQGPAAARNLGISQAKGTYIAFIDADDVWTPTHCTALLQQFAEHPASSIAMGYSQRFQSTAAHLHERSPLSAHDTDGEAVFMPSFGCALLRANVFQTVGLINKEYHWHEDVDWYLRALEQNVQISVTKEVVTYYRLHETNSTRSLRPTDHTLLHVLAKSLERRKNKVLPVLGKTTI